MHFDRVDKLTGWKEKLITAALLVWVRLKQVAHETQRTLYQVKQDLLSDYMRQQLRSPSVQMLLA